MRFTQSRRVTGGIVIVDNPRPGRHLLVASTGGHLAELIKWAPDLGSSEDSLWVTFDTPQSRGLLRGRRAIYVPYVAPRDLRRAAQAFMQVATRVDWAKEGFQAAISTGAAVAVPALAAARMRRVPSFYIESVCRVDGPSLTGRILAAAPGVHVSCQYESWAGPRWQYRGTLFDRYRTTSRSTINSPSIFVTLGTIAPYRFDSVIDAVLRTGLTDERTVWQTGSTVRWDLPGTTFDQVPNEQFDDIVRNADVVITHAGVGTIMKLLDMGKSPVVVPRRGHRHEHVDDHQTQIAEVLLHRGIATVAEVERIDAQLLLDSTSITVASAREQSADAASADRLPQELATASAGSRDVCVENEYDGSERHDDVRAT